MTQVPSYPVPLPARENALGIAGFVCSLVGLVLTGGILCPVGLVLSLVALGRAPRGFAVAGVIVGLVGSCGIVLVFLFAGAALLALLGLAVAAIALSEPERVEITSDMANMALAVKAYEREQGVLPASLSLLGLRAPVTTDPWGRGYDYVLIEEAPGFDIVSRGADGQAGTEDDVRLTRLGESWEPQGGFDVAVEGPGEGEADDGRVRIRLGDRTITASGDGDGGRVVIEVGGRTVEIVGDGAPGGDGVPGGDGAAEGDGAATPEAEAPATAPAGEAP